MSTAENTTGLAEVLAAHDWRGAGYAGDCRCGWTADWTLRSPLPREQHRAHVADMLTQVIEAREAELRANIGRQIRATAADPERRRPLALDAECPTDFANDFEWAARIAEGSN